MPLKNNPSPLKSANCPTPLFLCIESQKKLKFFILSCLTPFLTNFLAEISQFEFLVMAEKNTVVYKLLLLLNISDFDLFFL